MFLAVLTLGGKTLHAEESGICPIFLNDAIREFLDHEFTENPDHFWAGGIANLSCGRTPPDIYEADVIVIVTDDLLPQETPKKRGMKLYSIIHISFRKAGEKGKLVSASHITPWKSVDQPIWWYNFLMQQRDFWEKDWCNFLREHAPQDLQKEKCTNSYPPDLLQEK